MTLVHTYGANSKDGHLFRKIIIYRKGGVSMERKKDGIVIIDENTIYEIDTECMECRNYYRWKENKWEQREREEWNKRKAGKEQKSNYS